MTKRHESAAERTIRAQQEEIAKARTEKRKIILGARDALARRDGALELALRPESDFFRC